MKPQDIIFIIVLIALLVIRKPKILAAAGLLSLGLSILLFGFWVFFTAQRFTYYAAAFLLAAVLLELFRINKK